MNPQLAKLLFFPIYLPSFFIAVAQGLILLLIPLFSLEQGSSWLAAGFLFTLKNVGTLLSSLPGGFAIARFGEKKIMFSGVLLIGLACLSIFHWHSFFSLSFSLLLFGVGMGLWTLARQSFLSGFSQSDQRGRIMSLVASLQRTGTFLGPLLGGVLCQFFSFELAFLVAALLGFLSLLLLSISKLINQHKVKLQSAKKIFSQLPYLIKQHHTLFLSAGFFVAMLKLVRGARQLLLPLWGHHIGLSAAEIGFAFALSAFADVLLLYPGGVIADSYGRKWSGGLCLGILSLSLFLLPLSENALFFMLVALLAGIGNGLGGGIIMTLGADFAPTEYRGPFLGAWRLMSDVSGVLSPVLIGGLGTLLTLGAASVVSGGFGLLGIAVLLIQVKETLSASDSFTANR